MGRERQLNKEDTYIGQNKQVKRQTKRHMTE